MVHEDHGSRTVGMGLALADPAGKQQDSTGAAAQVIGLSSLRATYPFGPLAGNMPVALPVLADRRAGTRYAQHARLLLSD
jgi:hypothetical protein